jgi:hypothetical protein
MTSFVHYFRRYGTIDRPDGLDDADPKLITPSRWKAFTDVGLTEAMTRERWGASKWVRGQLRLWAVNPFDAQNEPDEGNVIAHHRFMEIIDPLWGKDMDLESKHAVLKRSCLIVITDDWLYYRIATRDAVEVPRLSLLDKCGAEISLIASSARPVVGNWLNQVLELPTDHQQQLEWEEAWMKAVMSNGGMDVPRLGTPPVDGTNGIVVLPPSQSQQIPPQNRIRAGVDGLYHFSVPRVQSGSVVRAKFRIPGAQREAPSTASASSSTPLAPVPLATSGPSSASSPTAPTRSARSASIPSDGPAKRVKAEPGVRASKMREIEELRLKLSQAEDQLNTLPVAKQEPLDEDDGFRDMVNDFVKETKETPMEIVDSD